MPVSESRRVKKTFLLFRKFTQNLTMRSDSFLNIEHLKFHFRELFKRGLERLLSTVINEGQK